MRSRDAGLLVCALVAGCVQTPYRDVVHDNGEGSVTVEHVPKEPPALEPSPVEPAPVKPASVEPPPAPMAAAPTDQQRVDALEARVRALSAENEKLKKAATTTGPAKD